MTAGIWSTARAREDIDNLPPYGPGVAIGETYDYVINVHCGVRAGQTLTGCGGRAGGLRARPPASGSVNWDAGDLEGERLAASVHGMASGDWAILDARGVVTLDVRLVLKTDDGALIFAAYRGRAVVGGAVFAAPTYDTGDRRYLWLNTVQAVAKGTLDGDELTYQTFEVRSTLGSGSSGS